MGRTNLVGQFAWVVSHVLAAIMFCRHGCEDGTGRFQSVNGFPESTVASLLPGADLARLAAGSVLSGGCRRGG